jgi:alkanesulfonate monooxygenase SsuD/methylene tetrahydromethanopterin reductase-like flavin-dependent oxidoreductase (luciferase family)
MSRPPFRFAVQATNASAARDWRDTAVKVQDLGYSTLFLADHYLGPGPAQRAARTPRQDLAPIAAMATAAAVTDTLRVGSRVFCIDYHVPAVLAKEAATLDLLSDGRLELGLGAGWSADEYAAMGLAFDRPGRRIAKLREVIALIKAHCVDSELDCTGEFVNVRGYSGRPQPVQRPHPPIMIGGAGERASPTSRSWRAMTTDSTHSPRRDGEWDTCVLRRPIASRTSTSRALRSSPRSPTMQIPRWRNWHRNRHCGRDPARASQRADRFGRRRRRRSAVASRRTGRQLRHGPAAAGRSLRPHCGRAARPVASV